MVKTISTLIKINAILLNIKIDLPKLLSSCGYKLAMNWQNFTEIHLAEVKILQKVLGGGGYFFWLIPYSINVYISSPTVLHMTITIRLILKMHTLHNSYSPVVITKVHTALNLAPSSKTLQNVWCQSMIITVAELVCILQCILHSVRHSHTIKIHQNIVLWLDHCGAYSIHEATSFFFWGVGGGGQRLPSRRRERKKEEVVWQNQFCIPSPSLFCLRVQQLINI